MKVTVGYAVFSQQIISFIFIHSQERMEPVPKKQRPNENLEEQLVSALRQILMMLEAGIQDGYITQQTYFTFHLLKYLVEVKTSKADVVLNAIPSPLVSELLRTLPDLFTPKLLLHLNDVHTSSGRSSIAKDLCVLRNYHLKNADPTPNT